MKSKKNSFWELFAYFRAYINFSRKYHICHFCLFLDYYCCAGFQKKLIGSKKSWLDVKTDERTHARSNMNWLEFPCCGSKRWRYEGMTFSPLPWNSPQPLQKKYFLLLWYSIL